MTRDKEINSAASKYIEDNSMADGYVTISNHKDSFIEGAQWADENPKTPWISVEDDLPYNHKKLINTHINLDYEKETVLVFTVTSKGIIDTDYMVYDNYDGWFWKYGLPKYWMPMPKLPKEGE